MIKVTLTNDIFKKISAIDENRFLLGTVELPTITRNKLRKNSKKKSSYASNKIEGNPLTEKQANDALESDSHKHFLKPEQEIRNYYSALTLLEEKLKSKTPFSRELVLEVQAIVEKGASKEKIGLRGQMPPGVLFAVYDTESGSPEYIPPEYSDIPSLLPRFFHLPGFENIDTGDWILLALLFLLWQEKADEELLIALALLLIL